MLVALACPLGVRSVKSISLNRYLLGTILFELFFFVPLGAYLYFYYPDWSLMYYIDTSLYPEKTIIIIGIIALISYIGAAKAGFFTSAWLIRNDNIKAAYLVLAFVLICLSVFCMISINQLMGVGSFEQYGLQTTTPIHTHLIGWIIGIDGACAGAFLLLLIKTLRNFETSMS